jgi:hypothetical protein
MRPTKGAELGQRRRARRKKLCKTPKWNPIEMVPPAAGGWKPNAAKGFGIGTARSLKVMTYQRRCPADFGTSIRNSGFVPRVGKMQRTRTYRRFAARCLEEARGTIDPRLKAFLAEMAQEWQRLAEETRGEKNDHLVRGPESDPGD